LWVSQKAFNIAFDALNCNKLPSVILSEGNAVKILVNGGNMSGDIGMGANICLTMSLQNDIIMTAVSLMDRKIKILLVIFECLCFLNLPRNFVTLCRRGGWQERFDQSVCQASHFYQNCA
jgi:hypothetical protein